MLMPNAGMPKAISGRSSKRAPSSGAGAGFGAAVSGLGIALSGFGGFALGSAAGVRQHGQTLSFQEDPMDSVQIHYPAVLAAAALGFAIGGLWYSPLAFAKAWLQAAGLTEEQTRRASMGKVFAFAALAQLVIALNLAAFIGPKASLGFGLFAGFAAGLGWVAMSLGVIYLFEQRPLKLWLINSGYQVVAYTVMGGVLGVWR